VKYGRTVEKGFLPVFSVETEDETQRLLTLTCPKNNDGEYIAMELVEKQSIENVTAFGDRLKQYYEYIKAK